MKRALVTGGSGGIGGAISRHLAGAGYQVTIHANANLAEAERLAAELTGAGHQAAAIAFDVTDREATEGALAGLLEEGPVQVLVNNAGIYADAPMAGMNWEQWRSVIDVSLHGFYNVTKPLLMPMMRTRWGRIITISSVSGLIGNRGQTNYSAAKSGLHGATRSLAVEVASRGITVNSVAPGIIEGKSIGEHFPPEVIKTMVPMQRAGTADEVASLVAYLASEEAAYISGQVISINGAMA